METQKMLLLEKKNTAPLQFDQLVVSMLYWTTNYKIIASKIVQYSNIAIYCISVAANMKFNSKTSFQDAHIRGKW